jgi:hypothetical protein
MSGFVSENSYTFSEVKEVHLSPYRVEFARAIFENLGNVTYRGYFRINPTKAEYSFFHLG